MSTTPATAATDSALPQWARRLLSECDALDGRAETVSGHLTAEQWNWQPRPDAWSVGQCLDHLRMTNRAYLPAIESALNSVAQGALRVRAEEIQHGWFTRWFMGKYIEPKPNGTRAKAPGRIVPAAKVDVSVLQSFLETNQELRKLIAKASAFDVNRIRFKNPLLPLIRFTVGGGLELVVKHQSRHLLQAERVRQAAL